MEVLASRSGESVAYDGIGFIVTLDKHLNVSVEAYLRSLSIEAGVCSTEQKKRLSGHEVRV
ncbi:MAG: hypothetical protein NUV80_05635 [Candidatus Berkelbacteria bacterium]|nr:hypothetical protein [Candidatus Berkelbacteria bacterium]